MEALGDLGKLRVSCEADKNKREVIKVRKELGFDVALKPTYSSKT